MLNSHANLERGHIINQFEYLYGNYRIQITADRHWLSSEALFVIMYKILHTNIKRGSQRDSEYLRLNILQNKDYLFFYFFDNLYLHVPLFLIKKVKDNGYVSYHHLHEVYLQRKI